MRAVKLESVAPLPPPRPEAGPPHRHPWLVGVMAALAVITVGTAIDYWRHARLVQPPLVFLAPITRGPVAARLHATGTLEARETRIISQPLAGRATEVAVRVGDRVTQGQVLVRFDPLAQRAEVARAESRLVAAEAQAFAAELVLNRVRAGNAGDGDGEDAQDLAQAKLATAAAEIEARTAAYRVAQRQLGDRLVRAPLAGVVVDRAIEPGQAVAAGAPLLVIAAPSQRLRLVVQVPEQELARISDGQPATFSVPALPGRLFTARVASHGLLGGPPGARHLPVILDVANDDGALALGMTATAEIDTAAGGPVFRVPLAALSFSPAGPTEHPDTAVWTGDPRGGALVRLPVEVGASDGQFAEVRGRGLVEGAMVAVGLGRPATPLPSRALY
jgi:HlyD family secretion protein